MTHDRDLEALKKQLRARLRSETEVALGRDDLLCLLDELGRLQQSNDRLRRQNRRVRSRLQRAGLADEPVGDEPGGEEPEAAP